MLLKSSKWCVKKRYVLIYQLRRQPRHLYLRISIAPINWKRKQSSLSTRKFYNTMHNIDWLIEAFILT